MDNTLATVDLICVDPTHVQTGRGIPEGRGALILNGRQWAYCSAARPHEPHVWKETGGVEFAAIRHADVPELQKSPSR